MSAKITSVRIKSGHNPRQGTHVIIGSRDGEVEIVVHGMDEKYYLTYRHADGTVSKRTCSASPLLMVTVIDEAERFLDEVLASESVAHLRRSP